MQTSKIKTLIIIALGSVVALLSTCEFAKTDPSLKTENQDTLFYSQWKKEKTQKLELVAKFESRIATLQKQKDSLDNSIKSSKAAIVVARTKTEILQKRLKDAIKAIEPIDSLCYDTLTPLIDSLVFSQNVSDSTCDDTIDLLQITLANRDTTIFLQNQMEGTLRDLNKESELRNQYLTEKLNVAYKAQRKKTRQNKILAGGLLILSGITASLLITQSLK